MGQAKQRGSREERIKQAQAREVELRKRYEEEMRARVAAIKQKERERLEAMTPEEREAARIKKESKAKNWSGIDPALLLALSTMGGVAAFRGKKR